MKQQWRTFVKLAAREIPEMAPCCDMPIFPWNRAMQKNRPSYESPHPLQLKKLKPKTRKMKQWRLCACRMCKVQMKNRNGPMLWSADLPVKWRHAMICDFREMELCCDLQVFREMMLCCDLLTSVKWRYAVICRLSVKWRYAVICRLSVK